MRQYNDWEEIDKDTNGLVTSLTYMVLFVNDQVYNYTVSLMEAIRNSEHYRHNAKRTANVIEREINAYNTNIFRIAKANKEAFAEITQSMEEDVQPHIDRYYYTISQIFTGSRGIGHDEPDRLAVINDKHAGADVEDHDKRFR
ncbi:hypothetical protein [Parabacteroides distasonis]|uniref:hypothetical protein n=1 Tax=Parabacteroides distasonis TaxID=823 RepID=UPI000E398A08|nr:hypothetical protein [Parabacteroides distasonis]REC35424.1 hypothetical protein CF162_22350 [Parabacteroides distasonis]